MQRPANLIGPIRGKRLRLAGLAAAGLWLVWAAVLADAAPPAMEYPGGRPPATVPGTLGRYTRCVVHTRGAPFYARPRTDSERIGQARFGDDFYVAATADNGNFLFAVTAAEDVHPLPVRQSQGWILRANCLMFVGGMGSGPEGLKDPQTTIHRKAMLVNRVELRGGVQTLLDKVPFLDRPDAYGQSRGERALFSIYYVYAEASPRGKAGHLLLGTEPRIGDMASQGDSLLGWVPDQRACQWNTREAVEFNKRDVRQRTQPCRIFLEADELRTYLEEEDPSQVPTIAEEDLTVKDWRFDQARFPLLDDEHRPGPIGIQGTQLYKIGFIGDVYRYSAERGGVERTVTARQVEELQARVAMLEKRTSKLQLCFLIDATFSMDPWIRAAADAVNAIVTGLQARGLSQREGQLQISVNFYRDKDDGPGQFVANPFLSPRQAGTILTETKAVGGGSPYEPMFAAICRRLACKTGAETGPMEFDPEAIKLLVLIGDDGNNPSDPTYTLDRVFQELRAAGGGSPVGFLAFPVGAGDSPYRRVFVEQTRELARRLIEAELAEYPAESRQSPQIRQQLDALSAGVVVAGNAQQLVETIDRRFQLALAEKAVYRRGLEYLRTGQQMPDSLEQMFAADTAEGELLAAHSAYGVVFQQRMARMIRQHGLEPLELAASGVQLFHEGWVAETDPLETFTADGMRPTAIRHVVLMHRSEVNALCTVLKVAIDKWQPAALEQTWKEGLDKLTGGDVSVSRDVSPQQLMRKHFGIKVKSGLLALTLDELSRQTPNQLIQARQELEESYCRLRDAYDSQAADYTWIDAGGTGRKALRWTNRRQRDYWWYGDWGDDVQREARAWIDREMLP